MDAKHTPGPWELSTLNGRVPAVREIKRPFGEASCYESSVRSVSGEHVCKLDFGYGRAWDAANAEFIVRCVNSHDELLAALKAIVAVLQKEAPGTPLNHHRYDAIGAQALKAIAKAEGSH